MHFAELMILSRQNIGLLSKSLMSVFFAGKGFLLIDRKTGLTYLGSISGFSKSANFNSNLICDN